MVSIYCKIIVENDEVCNGHLVRNEVYASDRGMTHKLYSEVSIIEKLPLEKNYKYLIIFLRTGQVQNNFYCTIILTYDLRFNT